LQITHDVLVVGGGLVGASLACALDGRGLSVGLVEASALQAGGAPSFDERNLALARASVDALDALGVWPLLATPPSPIEQIHVSSRGDFGSVRWSARERGYDAFGAVVVARELGAALEARLASLRSLTRYRPARVVQVQPQDDVALATLQEADATRDLRARLLVVADGTDSGLRDLLQIDAQRHDYRQTLFVTVAQTQKPHAQVAYERFTDSGPVAMLPLAGGRCGSICTVTSGQADAVAALDDAGYADLLQERFGWRLGRVLRVGRRSAYRLQQVRAATLVAPRAVLVGNAAQTLHPIGAQGFNLGLRDALTLADELATAARAALDVGSPDLLQGYAERRRADREATLATSDGLVRLFANRSAPLSALRSIGLLAIDRVPALAAGLLSGAMGLRDGVPRLERGAAR
jgi:2-octaprenyl-6-methoxyphenol hydroxylase